MKYSIIWRPHKINCTKVLIRFIWAWRFSNSHDQRQEPAWPWAWIMIKPDSMGSCLETKNKLHTVSFFLSFLKSSLILYSPVSGASSCVVAWSMELLWMWVSRLQFHWITFRSHQIQSLLSRFSGENITTTAITQITHYLVSSDQWIDKWLHIISFSKPCDK